MKKKLEGFGWMSVVKFEEMSQGLIFLEGNNGQEGVACECQIERSSGSSMAVPIFLPG